MLYEHFRDLKEINPAFIYNIEKDKEDRITCVLGEPYVLLVISHFGNVVTFDMTYETNCYGCIHRFQSPESKIVFASGFEPNERFELFVWLLINGLKLYPGGSSKATIID